MYLTMIFTALSLNGNCKSDTMKLPVFNGIIVASDATRMNGDEAPGISIIPTSDFKIKSCSGGEVVYVAFMNDKTYSIVIRAKSDIFYCYSEIDSVVVVKNQTVNSGDIIGIKTENSTYKEFGFWVLKGLYGVENTKRYLVY